MRRRKWLMLAIAVWLGVTEAGCSLNQGTEEQGNHRVRLRTVTMFGPEDANAVVYQQIREEFEESHAFITVEDESRSSDEQWKEEVAVDFCVGNEPDVLQFFTDANANQLVAMDKFVTIEEIQSEYPEYAADTYGWALEQAANEDGVQRAVPTVGFWEGVYCNRDLFESCGVPLPTDWESLEYAITVFRENGIVPIACSLNHVPHYWMEHLLLHSSGEEAYTAHPDADSGRWAYGLGLFAELREMGGFPDNTDSIDNDYAWKLFSGKQAAMLLEGSWYLPQVEDQENTVVIPFPGVPEEKAGEGTIIGGMTTGFYITRRAWNDPGKREAAVEYVMAHTSREAVQRYWENGGGTAVTAAPVEQMQERTPLAESAVAYLAQAKRRVLPTDSRMDPEAYNELISGIVNVSHGMPPDVLLESVLEISGKAEGESGLTELPLSGEEGIMYKVILIDDEPIIVQGLARSVAWEKYGCEIVDTAGDGLEGKRLIEQHEPDMVFLDICMPRMDGLAMVAALSSEHRNLQITVLTGFRDFDYAKRALNLGVVRYLLKPSNMEEIEEAIRFMASRVPRCEEEVQQAPGEHEKVASNFIVRNALAYIEENYKEKLLLSDVAEKTYVSQWHLSKLLNKETGQNFSELLNGIRIEKAKKLLEDPSLRIGDIAEEVGFLDLAHFSRVFKRLNGMSANEYRNRQKEH